MRVKVVSGCSRYTRVVVEEGGSLARLPLHIILGGRSGNLAVPGPPSSFEVLVTEGKRTPRVGY